MSAPAIHDEIVRTRPELARVLHEPWRPDLASSAIGGPVFTTEDGRLVTRYGPDYLHSALRSGDAPPLTPVQRAALAEMQRLTEDPRFALTVQLRAGDMQFLDNDVVLSRG